MRILVVEDDPEMGRLIAQWLNEQGYESQLETDGIAGLAAFRTGVFVAAAIDVMLPGMSGFDLSRQIRDDGSTLPIILLTARDAVNDRVFGLDAGADDYLIKPFDFTELGARLRSLVRRGANQGTTIAVGNVLLDLLEMTATVAGERLTLSVKEFIVLRLLAGAVGSVVTRATILQEVWGSASFIHPNIVDQYISILRRKVVTGDSGIQIVTVRRQGFVLEET